MTSHTIMLVIICAVPVVSIYWFCRAFYRRIMERLGR